MPYLLVAWWRHRMQTFSALLALCAGNSLVTGEFSAQRPVTRSLDISLICTLNKRLSKQSWGWWFETLSRSLSRHLFYLNAQNAVKHNKHEFQHRLDWTNEVNCKAEFRLRWHVEELYPETGYVCRVFKEFVTLNQKHLTTVFETRASLKPK